MISRTDLDFLLDLENNNNREWFANNKKRYEEAYGNFKSWVQEIKDALSEIDDIEESKVFRIYRDVRFSKDKSPYKTNFAASFSRKGKYKRGGFYLHVAPNDSMLGGGFWKPTSKDLKYIRDGILQRHTEYRSLLQSEDIHTYFGGIYGDAVKTAPKGYDRNHKDIDLIKNKQFILKRSIDDTSIIAADNTATIIEGYRKMLPYFSFMTDILVYDGNGEERD